MEVKVVSSLADLSSLLNLSSLVTSGGGVTLVNSVNGLYGTVVLDPDDLDDTATTNKFTTASEISKLATIEASATADQTGAEIKSLYEAEADTNAFTDAEQTKLGLFDPSANFSKTITIESPTSAEDITFWYTPSAITVVELLAIVQGTSSVTWTMHHDPNRSAAGNKIVTAGTTTDNTTTGESITSFDDGTIPAGSFIWFESSALVGTPDWFSVTMVYRVD